MNILLTDGNDLIGKTAGKILNTKKKVFFLDKIKI